MPHTLAPSWSRQHPTPEKKRPRVIYFPKTLFRLIQRTEDRLTLIPIFVLHGTKEEKEILLFFSSLSDLTHFWLFLTRSHCDGIKTSKDLLPLSPAPEND